MRFMRVVDNLAITVMFVFVGLLLIAFYDELYLAVKAQPQTVACRTAQMDYVRFTFTDSVVCVPDLARRDTLYIEGAKR